MTTGKTTSIGEALDWWLHELVLDPVRRIAERNQRFEPLIGEIYFRPTVLHARPDVGDIGSAMRRYRGIYQIAIFGPPNGGAITQDEVADLVQEHFVQQVLRRTVNVRIGSPDGSPSLPWRVSESTVKGWRNTPVNVPWWCDTF